MESRSGKIVKNTVFLYIRMLFLMAITLFTSRVILDKLGVENFGIYNVVGGISSMFIFFQSSLANATQRFLNVELGQNKLGIANKILCQHFTLYCIIACLIILLGETVGLWLIYNKLTIPKDRIFAAAWVYQFTLLSMCFTLIGTIFNSEIIAHEDMRIYSFVGIYEGIIRLVIAYIISIIPFDKLIAYGALMFAVSATVQGIYYFYCKKHYFECKLRLLWDKIILKKTFSIVGWNTIGTAVYAINDSGINILLNMFFGPIVNAARGISFQINSAVYGFANNFFVSVRPQIVKSYAQKDYKYLLNLFFNSSKYSFFLLWILCLPIILCIDQILKLWLKEVPSYTNIFSVWILLYSLVNVLNNPIWSIALATGKLKRFTLIGDGVFLMVFPLAYIFLKIGYSPVCVYVILLLVRICYIIVVLYITKSYINYSFSEYKDYVIIPIIKVVIVSFSINYLLRFVFPNTPVSVFCFIVLAILISCTVIWLIGTSESERRIVLSTIKARINNINHNS